MNNILFTIIIFLIICHTSYSQFRTKKIIVNISNKQPLEFVNIYNEKDRAISNRSGLFEFISEKNEINLNLLGFIPIKTTFDIVHKQDTIYMESKIFELKEVYVTDLYPFIKKVYDKMSSNYISNYTTDFFLRNLLKKGNDVVKLQDIYGKRNKNNNQKENIKIEILNMRKVSLFEKKNLIDLKFPDFKEFFSVGFPEIDKCNFEEIDSRDQDYRKILFEAKEKDDWGQTRKGYFIINRNDYAIIEYYLSIFDKPEDAPYKKIFTLRTEYKTIKYDRVIHFTKSNFLNKYYLSYSKLNSELEVLSDKKTEKSFYYNLNMDYFVTKNPTNEIVNANFSVDKDIFKVKYPYSEFFWNNQNQLPLTTELKSFLKQVNDNKKNKKEFDIIGNF